MRNTNRFGNKKMHRPDQHKGNGDRDGRIGKWVGTLDDQQHEQIERKTQQRRGDHIGEGEVYEAPKVQSSRLAIGSGETIADILRAKEEMNELGYKKQGRKGIGR